MVPEVIQLEEISWRLCREKRKCYVFIRAQSTAAQLQWLLIHCSLEAHTFLKICRRFSKMILGKQLAPFGLHAGIGALQNKSLTLTYSVDI